MLLTLNWKRYGSLFAVTAVLFCPMHSTRGDDIQSKPMYEAPAPSILTNRQSELWNELPAGLQGSFGSTDVRYDRELVPSMMRSNTWSGTAWKGERLSAQLVLWTSSGIQQVRCVPSDLRTADGNRIPSESIVTHCVKYVLSDDGSQECGTRNPAGIPVLMPDVLDTMERFEIPARSVRPLWLTLNIPSDARPGTYQGEVLVQARSGIKLTFTLSVEVLPLVLPPPEEWSFHLDLWQAPVAEARYHQVPLWSEEHFRILEPMYRMLAQAGQKCITTSIIHEPWGRQTYHDVQSMIEWIKKSNGTWHFDYTNFDKYVEFCMQCGITEQINCYSMIPWTNAFRYLDEQTGDYKYVHAEAGTQEYEDHWTQFLTDFVRHLKQKGWIDKTCIAMDERELDVMQRMVVYLKQIAPALRISLAGNYYKEIDQDVLDYCFVIFQNVEKPVIHERVKKSLPTTFYVACLPPKPNLHSFSPPAEAAWLGWFAASHGYNGFLFWAYDSWTENPLYDTRYVTWPAGDCYVVYPGGRSSIRFERLREGIQDYEKLRIVKTRLANSTTAEARDLLGKLNGVIDQFTFKSVNDTPCAVTLQKGKDVLLEVARFLATQKP